MKYLIIMLVMLTGCVAQPNNHWAYIEMCVVRFTHLTKEEKIRELNLSDECQKNRQCVRAAVHSWIAECVKGYEK